MRGWLEPEQARECRRVTLPLPPSTNSLFPDRGGRRRKSEAYRRWIIEAGESALLQRLKKTPPGPGPYELEVSLYFTDRRRRDASNYIKAIEDFLAAWMNYDDNLNHTIIARKVINRERKNAEVILRQILV